MSAAQERLNRFFQYDRATGLLYWKDRPASEFHQGSSYKSWCEKVGTMAIQTADRGRGERAFVRLDGAEVAAIRIILRMELDLTVKSPTYMNGNPMDLRWDNIKHNANCGKIERAKEKFKFAYWDEEDQRWRKFPRMAY